MILGILADVVVVIVLVAALAWGLASGVLAILGSSLGLVAGGLLVWWLLPLVAPLLPDSEFRGPLLGAGVIFTLVGGAVLGGLVGALARRGAQRLRLTILDRALGGGFAVVVTALALSLVTQSAAIAGVPMIASAASGSRVLGVIEALTPPPLAEALAQVRQLVFVDALPRVDALLEIPANARPADPVSLDDPALNAAAQSVARLSGTAASCSRGLTGSGFVVATDRVLTNAHVVAGVGQVVVELPGRRSATGQVVLFDPDLDVAVVAVDTEDAAPLPLAPDAAPGTALAVAGYPYGGPFTLGAASVLTAGEADVPDIYGQGEAPRQIYALDASVSPGNSGGPVLTADGRAAGIVFARAQSGDRVGYAVTASGIAPIVAQAPTLNAPVSTGGCTP